MGDDRRLLTGRSSSFSDDRKQTLTHSTVRVKRGVQLEEIKDRLKRVRSDSGLGVRRFAKRVSKAGYDVSHTGVNDYERGEARVPAEYVAAVARAFGLRPGWLLTGEGDRHPTPQSAKAEAFDRMAELVDAVRGDHGEVPPVNVVRPDQVEPAPRPDDDGQQKAG